MRINGFEQIKGFYSWVFDNQDKRVKTQHIALYLFLVNQNNRNNWIEWFKCPFDLSMAGACISSKKTYYSCLKDLQEWKLIQYQQGTNNWKSPLIKLEVLKDTSTVPQCEPQLLPQFVPLPIPQHIQALIQASIPQPIPNIKLLTNNLKQISDRIESVILFLKKEDNTEIKNITLPTETEFLDYCKSFLGIKYLSYEFSLKAKFESWVENKWKDGNDNKIKNWKTKIKNTLPFLKTSTLNLAPPELTPMQRAELRRKQFQDSL